MDDADRRLLNQVQDEIPIAERPFAEIGVSLGLDEDEVLRRLRAMDTQNVFRRVGPSFDPRRLGFVTTLVGAHVPKADLPTAAHFVNAFPQVTHNYEREDHFNLWFTLICRDRNEVARIVCEIRRHAGIEEIVELPASSVFKTRVMFEIEDRCPE